MVNKKLKNALEFDLFIKDDRWAKLKLVNKNNIITLINTSLRHLKLQDQINLFEFTIFLVNDLEMLEYNKKYRGKNSPTNTISFPTEDLVPNKKIKTFAGYLYAGEIFLSLETIEAESITQSKNFYDHFYHLLLHSLLHLLGYDHEKISERKKMEDIEIKILKQLNIANPYEEN